MYRKLIFRLLMSRLVKYLLIPTSLCLVLFPLASLFHQQTVKAQMVDAAEQLSASVSTFEGYLYDIRFATNRMFHDSDCRLLAASTNDNQFWDPTAALDTSVMLDEITYSLGPVSYSYITFAKNNLVVDDSRFYTDYNSFYPNILDYPDMTREQWEESLHAEQMRCLPAQEIVLYQTSYPDSYLTISQPFFDNNGRYTGTCTMLLREQQLLNQFLPYSNWKELCLFYIVADDGTILLRNQYEEAAPLAALPANGMGSYIGKDYLFVSREISGLNAVAVLGLPYEVFAGNLHTVNKAIFGYLAAGCFLFIGLSVMMTLTDMRQLMPMLETLGKPKKLDTREINDLILQKLQNHNQLSLELEKTRNQRDHSRMETLLKTGSTNTPTDRKQLCEKLQLTEHNCLLYIPAPPEPSEDLSEELRLMMIAEALEHCYGRTLFSHPVADGSVLAVLPMETGSEEEFRQVFHQTELLRTRLDLRYSLALSTPFAELEQISNMYWQARNILSTVETEQAICIVPQQAEQASTIPEVTVLEQLSECLLAGHTENALTLIEQFFDSGSFTMETFFQSFYSIRGVLLNTAQKINCEDISFLCTFDSRKPTQKLIEQLCECCLVIGGHVDSMKQSHNQQLQQSILKWLDENYNRPELNVAMAAEQFGISKKYVTQFLKDQTGKTFTEYLEDLRLSQAMELLRSTEMGVTAIATACGFTSQNTFYKAFRRRYQISPSAVRRDQFLNQ